MAVGGVAALVVGVVPLVVIGRGLWMMPSGAAVDVLDGLVLERGTTRGCGGDRGVLAAKGVWLPVVMVGLVIVAPLLGVGVVRDSATTR